MTRAGRIAAGVLALALAAAAAVWALNRIDEPPSDASPPPAAVSPDRVARGAYLARVGNCAGCHTERGGGEYAGGRGIATPFGTVFATNLTPHPTAGIGAWNATDFWRALHNGRSRDGRLLYPAFPYPSYTQVTREDADALYAYLRSLAPSDRPNRPHELRFPYGLQASLAVWRAMFFRPGEFRPDPARGAEWNRGAYLVGGLGHCVACHAPRNVLGATESRGDVELSGGLIPMQNWYAPSLASPAQAGVMGWSRQDVVALLRDGANARASVLGPMAEVVFRSTQHWSEADLSAVAAYLQALPAQPAQRRKPEPADALVMDRGRALYKDHCVSCHGEQGQGGRGRSVPPLAGNRAVTLDSPANVVRVILSGGYPPTTVGNPRPFGMPPYGQALADADVAAVASFIRQSWGNEAPAVSAVDVVRLR